MRGRIAAVFALLFVLGAAAAEVPAQTAKEVDHLFGYLAASGCEFNRNGDWHPAADARAHLEKKYRYLVKKGRVVRTEDFIALGATESSMSHKAYQVRCGEQTVPSATWLTEELKRFRDIP